MNHRYAPRLFLVTLALFWLSLLPTIYTRTSSRYSDEIQLPYTQLAGIEQLEFARIHADKEYNSNIEIHYVDQPHITVEFRGISDPAIVKNLFVAVSFPQIFSFKNNFSGCNRRLKTDVELGHIFIVYLNSLYFIQLFD